MARLRQQNPGNYGSSSNISADFENIIRYINRTELGDKTLGELMSTIFDEDGEFAGPIELRLDPTNGFQYRVGEYDDETSGWITIASVEDVRVGKFVVIEGRRHRYFSMLTDVALGTANPQILLDPPAEDSFLNEVMAGIGTFGTVNVTSYVPKSAKNSDTAWNGAHCHCSLTRTPIFGNH